MDLTSWQFVQVHNDKENWKGGRKIVTTFRSWGVWREDKGDRWLEDIKEKQKAEENERKWERKVVQRHFATKTGKRGEIGKQSTMECLCKERSEADKGTSWKVYPFRHPFCRESFCQPTYFSIHLLSMPVIKGFVTHAFPQNPKKRCRNNSN